jgi:hypothetical protein
MAKYLTRVSLVLTATLTAVALSLPLATASGQSSPTTPQTIVGEVTDTMCAPSKSHLGMMAKTPNMGHDASSCAKECARIGAKYALLDNQTGKVYQVDDQAKIAQFAGHRVKVTGTLTASGIRVANVNAIG